MISSAAVFLVSYLSLSATAAPALNQYPERAVAGIITSCTVPNTVALTFDDGPYIYHKTVSDTLIKNGAVGTFFLNGNNYDCIYDEAMAQTVLDSYNAGHQICSHTWSHPDLTTLNADQINTEMALVEQAIKWITGAQVGFMRPPYGSYNDLVLQVAAKRGLQVVNWDFDSGDSVGATVAQSKAAYDKAIAKHPKSILALNHETYQTTAEEVLPYAIMKLKAAGYKLVTVAQCLGESPYISTGPASTRNASWTCQG